MSMESLVPKSSASSIFIKHMYIYIYFCFPKLSTGETLITQDCTFSVLAISQSRPIKWFKKDQFLCQWSLLFLSHLPVVFLLNIYIYICFPKLSTGETLITQDCTFSVLAISQSRPIKWLKKIQFLCQWSLLFLSHLPVVFLLHIYIYIYIPKLSTGETLITQDCTFSVLAISQSRPIKWLKKSSFYVNGVSCS